jgi:tetratricopeptide (TPR) repeat protein
MIGRLDVLIAERPRWGVAHAARADLRMEYAMASKNLEDFRKAVEDYNKAEELLPDSPFVLAAGIRVLTNAVVFARHAKEDALAMEWQEQADQIAADLKGFPQELAGRARIATFYYATGREELAREIERELIHQEDKHGVGGLSPWAALLFPHRDEYLVQELNSEIENPTSVACRTDALMCKAMVSADEGKKDEAIQIFETLRGETLPDSYLLALLDIPLVLGRLDDAEELALRLCYSETLKRQWRWYLYPAQYFAGELKEEEMLERAGPFCGPRCMAHYAIAMKSLALGDQEKAKEHFRETVKTGEVGAWNYAWAKAFLSCMEDVTWLDRIQR